MLLEGGGGGGAAVELPEPELPEPAPGQDELPGLEELPGPEDPAEPDGGLAGLSVPWSAGSGFTGQMRLIAIRN